MKTGNITYFILFILIALFTACNEDGGLDMSPQPLDHSFTLTSENTFTYEISGESYTGGLRVINSLNNDLYISVDLFSGGGFILPKTTGNFISGYDFGPANGTEGNNAYLNVFITHEYEKYYAYSSHAYGYLEDKLLPGSECTIQIVKFEGDYQEVEIMGMNGYGRYTLFVGEVDVLFAGIFKTADGSKTIEVEKGQLKILNEVNGTTVRYPED